MIRVYAVVEGETEEAIARRLIAPAMLAGGVSLVPMRVLRGRGARGGGSSWQPYARHLRRLCAEHRGRGVRFTTMIDLYALPNDTPGHGRSPEEIEAAIAAQLEPDAQGRARPYVQTHEVEALLYADLEAVRAHLPDLVDDAAFDALRRDVAELAPEEIDDGYETYPSRRLARAVRGYRKVAHGPAIAQRIGLPAIRAACPRFDAWCRWLEAPGDAAP